MLPAIREALRQAGDGAVDEVIFLDLLREQHREVLFPRWQRPQGAIYPTIGSAVMRAWDERGWDRVESRLIGATLERCARLGLIRRAPGVFAGTADGRLWAGASKRATPPLWVSSDLELVVPPEAVTPWERYQLERLGHCTRRGHGGHLPHRAGSPDALAAAPRAGRGHRAAAGAQSRRAADRHRDPAGVGALGEPSGAAVWRGCWRTWTASDSTVRDRVVRRAPWCPGPSPARASRGVSPSPGVSVALGRIRSRSAVRRLAVRRLSVHRLTVGGLSVHGFLRGGRLWRRDSAWPAR